MPPIRSVAVAPCHDVLPMYWKPRASRRRASTASPNRRSKASAWSTVTRRTRQHPNPVSTSGQSRHLRDGGRRHDSQCTVEKDPGTAQEDAGSSTTRATFANERRAARMRRSSRSAGPLIKEATKYACCPSMTGFDRHAATGAGRLMGGSHFRRSPKDGGMSEKRVHQHQKALSITGQT